MKVGCYPKEGKRGVLTIFIDGQPWREIHTTIFGRRPKIPKDVQTRFSQWELQRAKSYALNRLAKQNQPSNQLEKSLRDRLVTEPTIAKIIADCQRLGYLNDEEWMESYIRSQQARHLGPERILLKLREKGISREQALAALDKQDDAELRAGRIRHLLTTRYRSRDLADYKERQKVIAALIRKGFSFSEVIEEVKRGV